MLDLTVGVLALLFLWPVMLAVAILIRLDSPGPVLFRQKRVGWHGDTFTMYKFRSMVTGADQQMDVVMDRTEDGRHFMRKTKDDPRVTRLGRLLRRWSLDELPQFLNVVKGNMSLVGPRPELPSLVREYEPWQRKRLAVPPGMTGWWQVSGRSDSPLALSTEADLYYVRNYSLFFDLQIIFRTVGAVVSGRGAY
jgi:exopolysaccharide biosynthesis polyprenyl glycosylphosphotransferase